MEKPIKPQGSFYGEIEKANKLKKRNQLIRLLIFCVVALIILGIVVTRTLTRSRIPQITVNGPELSVADIPAFSGKPYAVINNNYPQFIAENIDTSVVFEEYSSLDSLGRCGPAFANLCKELFPEGERESISGIYPSGWNNQKIGSGNKEYLFNRCHLIAFQLAGENANERNLITGTRYMNYDGMLPFENMVHDYICSTDNHVLYRVTPIFQGENLIPSGVTIEAWSVEDKGKGICLFVYLYNVQPGFDIDYSTGESKQSDD